MNSFNCLKYWFVFSFLILDSSQWSTEQWIQIPFYNQSPGKFQEFSLFCQWRSRALFFHLWCQRLQVYQVNINFEHHILFLALSLPVYILETFIKPYNYSLNYLKEILTSLSQGEKKDNKEKMTRQCLEDEKPEMILGIKKCS